MSGGEESPRLSARVDLTLQASSRAGLWSMEMVELYRRRARRTLADLEAEDYSEDTGFGELMGLATNRLISSGQGMEVIRGTGG